MFRYSNLVPFMDFRSDFGPGVVEAFWGIGQTYHLGLTWLILSGWLYWQAILICSTCLEGQAFPPRRMKVEIFGINIITNHIIYIS